MEYKKDAVNLQAVFFDFDGVILDSVNVKTEAFAKMFRNYGTEIEKQVVEYHLVHGGVSRFEKFRYYYEQLLDTPISKEQLVKLGETFSQLSLQGVLEAPFIEGALESLKALHQQKILSFVVSGTPHEEILHIVQKRNLSMWFKEVHGSPRLKHEIVLDILTRYDLEPKSCLFIGDAMTDYDAAKATGIRFLGIISKNTPSHFPHGTSVSLTVSFL
ncbi:MAG: HAD family hydrolase [Desulfamplus sp.]|nr:HAD family hydrolase [Desulfamplus sp.]